MDNKLYIVHCAFLAQDPACLIQSWNLVSILVPADIVCLTICLHILPGVFILILLLAYVIYTIVAAVDKSNI